MKADTKKANVPQVIPQAVETPEAARGVVNDRVLEVLRNIRKRGTPEQSIQAAELEKLVLARQVQELPAAA